MSLSLPTPLDDALNLDLFVLTKLLNRNWSAQGKTRYFQRTSMVLRAVKRYKVQTLRERIDSIQKQCVDEERTKRKQEEWVLHSKSQEDKSAEKLRHKVRELHDTLVNGLPEILSRIQHASSALLTEIARGYFLPFCTIAISALARVRALVMRIGREGLVALRSCWSPIMSPETLSSQLVDDTMKLFVEEKHNKSSMVNRQKRRYRQATRTSLGLQAAENKKMSEGDESSSIATDMASAPESSDRATPDIASNEAEALDHQDDYDLGESVDFSTGAHDTTAAVKEHKSNKNEPSVGRDDGQDAHMGFVQQLQAAKSDASSKSKKRKGDTESKSKKERRKKKRKKKADVFDEIFGDA